MTNHSSFNIHHSALRRRGVLLLIILALLAMFGLIAVAFVVISGQAQRSARSVQRFESATDPWRSTLRQAAMQVFRGTNSAASVIGAHSLLEDIYGNSWFVGKIGTVQAVCGGQLIEFTYTLSSDGSWNPASWVSDTTPQRRIGCVVSIYDGTAAGTSTRIVGFNPSNNNPQMLAVDGLNIASLAAGTTRFLINGVPFSGTGFGYNGATIGELALQPNPIFVPEARNPAGGANSDYTAADFQHMLLAAQVPQYNATGQITGVATIPSLHRPALVRYQNGKGVPAHNYILRPIGGTNNDHPNFTGSNPAFTTDGPWDVDNDGDGIPDSVWVDLGQPVRTTADGRLYKPLFAILCVDLDGRLNLNAHGSLQQLNSAYYQAEPVAAGLAFAGGTAPTLHRGPGFGPAEINLRWIIDPTFSNLTLYQQLLTGNTALGYEGRYGRSGLPGVSGVDVLNFNKWFEYANCNYWGNFWTTGDFGSVDNAGAYGSPPDPFGQGVVALDAAGRPMYLAMGGNTLDNPYELDLGVKAARGIGSPALIANKPNNLFSPAELERVLRPFDRDATGLPIRLAALAPGLLPPPIGAPNQRHAVTTESWDLPCPNVSVVPGTTTRLTHVTDLLAVRGVPSTAYAQLLPPDLRCGLRMNINRPFGNGRDDNNVGVVDCPPATGVTAETDLLPPTNVPFSYDGVTYGGAGALAGNSLQARQLEVRYLYVLMCLTADMNYLTTQLGNAEEAARFVAQWAVNVVDFRDRDSIMTPFEYDPNPFTAAGWRVDGNLATNDGITTPHVVWGCERPELLIAETLAFHDRRTENTADEDPDIKEVGNEAQESGAKYDPAETDEKKKDVSFDQSYRPQGSLFIELYNPSSPLEPRSGDFYAANGALDLTRVTAAGATGKGYPVWRLMIARPNNDAEQPDPDDPVAANPNPAFEREVYFVDKTSVAVPLMIGQVQYFPASTIRTTVSPGGYAVIGPGEKGAATHPKRTYIGWLTGQSAGSDTTRYISLDPVDANPLVVRNNTNSPADPGAAQINPPALLAIDEPRRLSVTEPVNGYEALETAAPDAATGKYAKPDDIPFDSDAKRPAPDDGAVLSKDQTVPRFRVVYLQRLANPMAPWHATDNPYRTIDMMPIDVTAFNGVTSDTDPQAAGQIGGGVPTHFQARQRGENNDASGACNIWKQEPVVKSAWGADAPNVTGHHFNKGLKHSLGYLNQWFGPPQTGAQYKGAPQQPFPWLTWNNRPFVSPLELLLVPAARSSKLLVNAGNNTGDASYNKYFRILKAADVPQPYAPTLLAKTLAGSNVPYPHLLNFFQSGDAAGTVKPSPQFHRILEYLNVPSWYTGTEVQVNPTAASGNAGVHAFHPPFNRIPTYREPGRINLNTIYRPDVFMGLMNGFPFPPVNNVDIWTRFVFSRRGDTQADILAPTSFPTEFANPFRSYGGATLTNRTPDPEINATLLRADPTDANKPLFEYTSTNPADETNRNPYFRYEGLQRLGNLVTTRSNVYAVWITVGYFEVEPAIPPDPTKWPDGFQLSRELGMDTGEIERHRAFYIFDRSIPVGFQRGQDLNVKNAILVERYIE